MEEGGCDDEEGNHLNLEIQMQDKKVNGCVENQLSGKLTDLYDLLTEDTQPRENYQPIKRREIVLGDDNHEANVSVCHKGKNQASEACSRRLGKETNESHNCQTLTDLTDPFSLSTAHTLLGKDCQQIETTLLYTDDNIKTGLCFLGGAEMLPTLSGTSHYSCSMEISGVKDSQSVDSDDPVSSDPVCKQKDGLRAASSDPICEQKDSKLVDSSDPVTSDPASEKKEHADFSDPASEWKDSQPVDSSEQKDCQYKDSSDPISEQKDAQPSDSSDPVSSEPICEQKVDQPVDSNDPISSNPISEQKYGQPAVSSSPVSSDPISSDSISEQKDDQPADSNDPICSNLISEQKYTQPSDSTDPVSSDPVSSDPVSEQKVYQSADSNDPASSNPISEQKYGQSADSSDPVSSDPISDSSDPVSSDPISDSSDPVSSDPISDSCDPVSSDPISEQKDGQTADSSDPVSSDPISEQNEGQPLDSSDPVSSLTNENLPVSSLTNENLPVSSLTNENLPVSSLTNENLVQRDYKHNQTSFLETVHKVDNTLYCNDKVKESLSWRLHCNKNTRKQSKSPCNTDSVNSFCNENLIQRKWQFTQEALVCKDNKMKTDLCKSDKVETPFPCRTISDTESRDKKEEILPLTCVDVPVDFSDPFGLSAGELSEVGSEYFEHTALNSRDNLKLTLHTSGQLSLPGNSNSNKGGNENNELLPVKPCDPFNLSVEEDRLQSDYESVKMKLLELKDKFDKAVCNSDTDKRSSSLIPDNLDEKIKLTHGDKSTAKTDDPFDLSSEDDLYPEKYRPLKRKLCTDSKDCNKNSNSRKERAEVDGAAAAANGDSQAVAVEAVLLKAPVKKQRAAYRVAYVHSQKLLEKANELIRIHGRAELVHSLISSFGLLQYLQVVSPRCATDTEILGFHCPDYISFLRDSGDVPDGEDRHDSDAESYGLSYDCPLQTGIFETCSLISGATIVAAETLISNAADVVINWYGGWHHAKRDSAAGFCYINDIVLGILKLREKFDQILYVDIDLHHGDGVEEAFCMSPKVMTVSFHKYMFGFFPGTGSVTDIGTGKGKCYSVNVPLMDGIKDAEFCAVFFSIMKLVREKFQPQVIVLQCGADTLSSDPMTSFNLTHLGISRCVGLILSWNLPTMLLGGGGYNFPNTAKCWSFLTSLAAGKKLPLDIPEHEHLLAYGPDFEMSTTAGNRKDCNTRQHLTNLVAKISRNLSSI